MNEQFMLKFIELSDTVARIDERSKIASEKQEVVAQKVDSVDNKIEKVDEKVNSIDARLKIIEERKSGIQHIGTAVKYCWNSKPIRYVSFIALPVIVNIICTSLGFPIPAEIMKLISTLATI